MIRLNVSVYKVIMIVYNKQTNEIARTDDECGKIWFEIDEMIAPLIQLCNSKGYTTMACCSDHPIQNLIELNGNHCSKRYNRDIEEHDKGTTGKYVAGCVYIAFTKTYKFPNLPKNVRLRTGFGYKNMCALEYYDKAKEHTLPSLKLSGYVLNNIDTYYDYLQISLNGIRILTNYFKRLPDAKQLVINNIDTPKRKI